MKLNSNIDVTGNNTKLQFAVEFELDDNADITANDVKTKKVVTAFKNMINEVMSFKNNQRQISAETNDFRQSSTTLASPGQIKYLNDLTGKCGTDLKRWCKGHGVKQENITGAHCQEWIPELLRKSKDKINDNNNDFVS